MIIFENKGIMPLEAATTFGINMKLGENPIGFFGTGLKYAIAVTLRLGGTFRLFLGKVEYEFYVIEEDFRGKEFGMIRMRKRKGFGRKWKTQKLGYTTELGKHWEPWMAVREIESNTRDENGWSTYNEVVVPAVKQIHSDGITKIIVECPEMEEAYLELDKIFRPDTKLLAEIGPLNIYKGESDYIFFRGLRVTDLSRPSLYTYDFDLGITLTEDRTSKWPHSDSHRIMEALMSTADQDIIDTVLDADEDKYYEGSLPFDQPYVAPSTPFFASMGYRVNTGGNLPKRVRTMYRNLTAVRDRKETMEVSLTEEQIRRVIKLMDDHGRDSEDDAIIEALKETLNDEEIQF